MPIFYLFEVRQIQSFIFATNKLRDATGASELINSIVTDDSDDKAIDADCVVGQVLQTVGLVPAHVRRATGAVVEFECIDADAGKVVLFRTLLRLRLASDMPGLAWSDGVGATSEAARKTAILAQSDIWPMISPLTRPAPLSGGVPAVAKGLTKGKGVCRKTGSFADMPTLKKRAAEDRTALAQIFLPAEIAKRFYWPVEFPNSDDDDAADLAENKRVFPFVGAELRRIALIHADGNGMGALFQKASEGLTGGQSPRALSRAIARATRNAVQTAMGEVVVKAEVNGILPCRPILLGGDDVTLILRADLALPFARAYVGAFEAETKSALAEFGIPDGLTAKVGIVFLAPNQPFGAAHRLCESLASSAKDTMSRVAFWRLTTSAIPRDVSDIDRMALGANGIKLRKTSHDLAELAQLQHFADLLANEAVGSGAMRKVPELLRSDVFAARRVFARAVDIVREAGLGSEKDGTYAQLTAALHGFGMTISDPINASGYSPLWEAHELRQITKLTAVRAEEGVAA